MLLCINNIFYRAFHRFKFADGGSILGSSQIYTTIPAASKNDAQFESGKK